MKPLDAVGDVRKITIYSGTSRNVLVCGCTLLDYDPTTCQDCSRYWEHDDRVVIPNDLMTVKECQ